jgi:hypothetical protein
MMVVVGFVQKLVAAVLGTVNTWSGSSSVWRLNDGSSVGGGGGLGGSVPWLP